MSQMKEQDQATARDLNEMDISYTLDRKFKVMMIKILPGLEKIVEDISETLNTEVRKNQSQI